MKEEYNIRYHVLDEDLPIGNKGDMLATLELAGEVVTTWNIDHVLWERFHKEGYIQ